jgi:N-acetyl-anhydromuramyl-L-alanine amidase AmpD
MMTMALNRVWIPSPNYSSRGGSAVRLCVIHTAEGATTIESLGSWFANPSAEVSSHVGIDDKPGTVGEYVRADQKSWCAANANPYSIQAELCGFAAWSPAEWQAHGTMLETCAAWIAEECARFGIPVQRINESQAAAGQAGVLGHADLGYEGNDHWDPGPSFPWDDVLAMAGGRPGVAPPSAPSAPSTGGGTAPPWPGRYLKRETPMMNGQDVMQWQSQMHARGWDIVADAYYGPQSEDVCQSFQAEKGLDVDAIVGPETWAASWTAPVT